MMKNPRKAGLLVAVMGVLCFAGLSKADLTGVVGNKVSIAVGTVGGVQSSTGTLVLTSTSSTAGYKFFKLNAANGTELLSVTQGGNMTLAAGGQYLGSGAALTGLPGLASTSSWSGSNTYTEIKVSSDIVLITGSTNTVQTGVLGFGAPPTRQVLTSGSGATYTTPLFCRQLRVRMVGGGGGGGSSFNSAATGTTGNVTTFNSVNANGGLGGSGNTGLGASAAAGGTGGTGTASFRSQGGPGGTPGYTSGPSGGLDGGSSALGGGAASPSNGTAQTGASAAANTGGGGSGGISLSGTGGGGGGGEYVELIIGTSAALPAATYTYTVGASAAGGAGGSFAGGAGGSGVIIVDEYY